MGFHGEPLKLPSRAEANEEPLCLAVLLDATRQVSPRSWLLLLMKQGDLHETGDTPRMLATTAFRRLLCRVQLSVKPRETCIGFKYC